MRNRIPYIDNIKCFAIICVMLGHALQYLEGDRLENVYSFNFIYTFHMPLFMMVSGYFFSSSLRLSFGDFIKKKFTQLLLPGLTWSLAKYLIGGGRNLIGIIDFYWFLKSVFFCYIITFIAIKVIKREKVAFCFLILISLLVNLDISTYMLNYMLPCFIFGSIINRHIHFFMNYKIVLLSISIFLYILMLPYWEFSEYHYLSIWQEGTMSLQREIQLLHRLIIGLSGSLAIFLLFTYTNGNSRIVQIIGSSTLGLYVMNGLLSDIQRHFFMTSINNELLSLVIACIIVVVQIPLFLFLMNILKRNKLLGLLLFGYKNIKI